MNQEDTIQKTIGFVKDTLFGAEAGHDWWHIYRVWQMSRYIVRQENADAFVVELGALLHDIADSKFHEGNEEKGPRKAREFLASIAVKESIISHVEKIVEHISFKGAIHSQPFRSNELDIVQDADRLDALGAIGIARAFSYGGYAAREIYNPNIKPKPDMTKEEYKKNNSSTINHFYEKLLLLKDRMNTETARSIAKQRHDFMKDFLDEFYKEWDIWKC